MGAANNICINILQNKRCGRRKYTSAKISVAVIDIVVLLDVVLACASAFPLLFLLLFLLLPFPSSAVARSEFSHPSRAVDQRNARERFGED